MTGGAIVAVEVDLAAPPRIVSREHIDEDADLASWEVGYCFLGRLGTAATDPFRTATRILGTMGTVGTACYEVDSDANLVR